MNSAIVHFDPIEKGIVSALCYASVFKFPLTINEIFLFSPEKIANHTQLQRGIDQLLYRKIIVRDANLFALAQEKYLIDERKKRSNHSKQKEKVTQKWLSIINWIPWIQAIYLTGSIAVGNASEEDDIDLMFITSPNRLWLSRMCVTVCLSVFGLKRTRGQSRGKSVKNKFCTNLFLDTTSLSLPKHRHNLYTAHEIIQAKLVSWRKGFDADLLLKTNRWVSDFLPNTQHIEKAPLKQTQTSFVGNVFEFIAFKLQTWYMQSHKTNEQVSQTSAFFHPRKTGELVLEAYQRKLALVL